MSGTRVLYSDNGTLTDFTRVLEEYDENSVAIPAFDETQDYIYVGQRHPFNHIFFKPGAVANEEGGAMEIEYWDGDEWIPAVEVIDETDALGVAGFITWTPNKSRGWMAEDTASPESDPTGNEIEGLENVIIYDHYWMRIKLAVTPTAEMELNFVGQKFATDQDLGAEFSELLTDEFLDVFSETAGAKEDWEEQHIRAAEVIVTDLITKNIIWHKGQILERKVLKLAAVQKLAEIIFNKMGPNYWDRRDACKNEYYRRLTKGVYQVDKDKDALLSPAEAKQATGWMSR